MSESILSRNRFPSRAGALLLAGLALAGCSSEGDGFSGGCAPFPAYAQNRHEPTGAAVWKGPDRLSPKRPGFSPNEIVAIDGWVATEPAYPTNPRPYNSAVWFHLANPNEDGYNWVNFAAVRLGVTSPDNRSGDTPVPTTEDCHGSYSKP